MQELVVIAAGLLLGLGATRITPVRVRAAVVVIGAIVLGTAWSRIVGEAEALAWWDVAQALGAAVAGLALGRLAPYAPWRACADTLRGRRLGGP